MTYCLLASRTTDGQKIMFDFLKQRIPHADTIGDRYPCYKELLVGLSIISLDEKTDLMNLIINEMKQHTDSQLIYLKFLKAILMSSVAKLPVDGFPFLMNSEASWSVFSKILSKRGLSFMDPSSIRELFPIFRVSWLRL